jgi:hypothetical protein
MLRVRGDSMTGAAIVDGDLVVIRKQEAAENGEIVAARFDGPGGCEATVKTLQRTGGHAWLMPANPAYEPIPADDAVILGTVSPSCPRPEPGPAGGVPRPAVRRGADIRRRHRTRERRLPGQADRGRNLSSAAVTALMAKDAQHRVIWPLRECAQVRSQEASALAAICRGFGI